jgi:hypothetical protein
MPDRRAAQLAVQTEQRHQVDRREGVGGHGADVGEVSGVQACGVHQIGFLEVIQRAVSRK